MSTYDAVLLLPILIALALFILGLRAGPPRGFKLFALSVAFSALAVALTTTDADAAKLGKVCAKADHARAKVIRAHGRKSAGRDICKLGMHVQMSYRSADFPHPDLYEPSSHDQRREYLGDLRALIRPYAHLGVQAVGPRTAPAGTKSPHLFPASAIARCIVHYESGGDPQANNGTHFGIGQWDIQTWYAHGGGRFASSPLGATEQEQLITLDRGLRLYGCAPWCPFDPC